MEDRNDRQGLRPIRLGIAEATGAVADLGVLVPLATALVLVNGLDPGAVLLGAGLLALGAGLAFRIPFPVQPLKALTAVAVATAATPEVIHAAGLEIAAFLLLLSVRGVADAMARLFTRPVVRGLQVGVGLLLVIAAGRLVLDPPPVFQGTPPSPWPVVLAIAAFAGLWWAAREGRHGVALGILVLGILVAWLAAAPDLTGPSLTLPSLSLPPAGAFGTALVLLVIPQLPLTFGNAVVGVHDLAHEYFGVAAARVTPSRICVSCGMGNVLAAVIGGMPMCHGAGGLTAHVRLGGRTAGTNLLLGGGLALLGLFFAPQAPEILGLLPAWGLAALLAIAGLRHALLARDLRGAPLAVALAAGVAGALAGNLTVTLGIALAAEHLVLRRSRAGRTGG